MGSDNTKSFALPPSAVLPVAGRPSEWRVKETNQKGRRWCRVIEIQRIRERRCLRNKKKYKEREREKKSMYYVYPFRMMDGIKFIPFFFPRLPLSFGLVYLFKAIALDGRTRTEMQSVPATLSCLAFVSFKYIDRSSSSFLFFFPLLLTV